MIGYGTTGTSHDFFCFNAAGQVWNGSAFVTWSDGAYATYRVGAVEQGTSGQFAAVAPAGTVHWELRERGASLALSYVVWVGDSVQALLEADQLLVLDAGVWKLRTYARGTLTEIVPEKTAKQPGGANLTDPTTQLLAGYTQ